MLVSEIPDDDPLICIAVVVSVEDEGDVDGDGESVKESVTDGSVVESLLLQALKRAAVIKMEIICFIK